jgi:Pyridoxamine 5'-phosphate oxidase
VASWTQVAESAPPLAATVQQLFEAHKHKTMATIRKDGSPRISGIEVTFEWGDLRLRMMPESRKERDLKRDPRLAVHTVSIGEEWTADANLSGRAIEEPEGSHSFRIEIEEVVLTRLGDPSDHLVIEWWSEPEGSRQVRRR